MKPKAYVETTVISYLAASPSRDIVVAAHQQLTHEWWERRDRFELVVSQAVVDELSRGDAAVAARRLAFLAQIPVLDLGDNVNEFARKLLRSHAVPSKANLDAVHIAVAAVNHVSYLSRGIVRTSRTPRFVARLRRRAEALAFRRRPSARRKN